MHQRSVRPKQQEAFNGERGYEQRIGSAPPGESGFANSPFLLFR
jgi:hypothetical protein